MLDELEEILGVNFQQEVSVRYLNLEKREDQKRFRKDGGTLHLNLASLEQQQLEEILELSRTQFNEKGRILRLEEETVTEAMQNGYSEELDEIATYFDGVLSDRYHNILKKALRLRAVIKERDLSKDEIQEKKGQIARRHGGEAIYLSSLVSAKYFDRDGGLRDIYVDMELNPEYDRLDFQSTLEEYVEKELICVFVENDESVYDVTQDVRAGLWSHQQEEPIQEWFDVRGIGDGCAEIINSVMENLEDDHMGIDYDRWRDGDDLWVRIYPRSLGQLPG